MKEFPFSTIFSCILKPVISEEKDKFLAIASLQELGKFVPDINLATNIDLLPVAFNACVVNRINKNGDVIDTKTALSIYKNFINRPINSEHNRQHVIGTILMSGFSEFGTDKPLTLEEVQNKTEPFNITLGGIVWRIVNPEIADDIEETNDPTSDKYLGISASWELGFSDYYIVELPIGKKNLTEGKIITELALIEELKKNLKSLGGDGKVDDTCYYRQPINDVLPLGIGFTEKPAAEVKGIAVPPEIVQKNNKSEASAQKLPINTTEGLNIISQIDKMNVKTVEQVMKIASVQDINDESLKQATATEIADVIAKELKEKSSVWEQEKKSLDSALAASQETCKKVEETNKKLVEDMKNLQATVDSLSAEKVEREKLAVFNNRMSEIASAYEFDTDAVAIVANELKSLASEEEFASWKKKASILYKGFAKKKVDEKKKADKEDDCADDKDKMMDDKAKKKSSANTANASTTVDDVIDNATNKDAGLPNTASASETSLKEKYKNVFAKENLEIKY